ncbi:hypothetical protein [Hymenobacter fodinae]|uniref:Uncharacterized protein n=1 Tax=Hymenobacter fodinae TaxID=2510796 RepID=A0A4Z0PA29_9BACT|nr:hypothetical protein [Hymenobacter fodinae]TGE08758.1 hypothetical protein EU556_13815 [Hymenobacter fodinae]
MPALGTVTIILGAASCKADGGVQPFTLRTTSDADANNNTNVQYSIVNEANEDIDSGGAIGADESFQATALPNGSYTIYATDHAGASTQRSFTVDCHLVCDIATSDLAVSQPIAPETKGTVSVKVTTSADTFRGAITALSSNNEVVQLAPIYTSGQTVVINQVPQGSYRLTFTDSDNCSAFVEYSIGDPVEPEVPPQEAPELMPADFTPVHLPVIIGCRMPATVVGEADMLFVAQVSHDYGATWSTLVRLVRSGTAGQLLSINLSEYLKAHFTISAPVESGPDAALVLFYRANWGLQPAYTGATGTPIGGTGDLRVLNAAERLPVGQRKLSRVAYANVPEDFARFENTISLSPARVVAESNIPESATEWPCPQFYRQFVWLNRFGGWDWGLFRGKHEHGTDVADGTGYTDETGTERYASRGPVRRTMNVYSDRLTATQAAILRGIRSSIQVYERLPTGQYVPLKVQPGSFRDYQVLDKIYVVDFTVAYSPLLIQTQ